MTISNEIFNDICKRLGNIESEHNVRILFAVESGSRAWGIESPNSDYDVRFVYVHPEEWYLSIHEQRDVIEIQLEGDLDISGWDLRKTLRLMHKGNPVLFEWLRSPILYDSATNRKTGEPVIENFRELSSPFFNETSAIYHYLHMAKRNFREYLKGETVKLKKYLYVLRPICASLWIIKGIGQPPMRFEDMLDGLEIPARVREEIASLLRAKKSGDELASGPKQEAINEFLETSIAIVEEAVTSRGKTTVSDDAKQDVEVFFRKLVHGII